MTAASGPHSGPHELLGQIARCGLIAVIRSPSSAAALKVGRVLVEAGVEVLEVTGTTPDSCGVLAALRREAGSQVVLGIGSIRGLDDVRRAEDVGADFLVSPGSPGPLIEAMLATGRLVLPGVLTPTDVMQAQAVGINAMKLFPAQLVGLEGLRALLGPFPDVAFVPTGGIAPQQVRRWLDAGALAVGVGGSLAPAVLSTDADEADLISRVRDLLDGLAERHT